MLRAVLGMLLAATLAIMPVTSFADENAIKALARISPAVGALYSQTMTGDLNFNCTVTAVDRTKEGWTVLLTAFHCVRKGTAYLVTFDGIKFYHARVWKIPQEEVDKVKYPRSYREPQTDMALFLIDETTEIPLIPIGDDAGVVPGNDIAVVGFPMGVTKVRYVGTTAGRIFKPGSDTSGYIILQVFGAPGNSGSAVVDMTSGKIVAVLVAGVQGGAGTAVILATPISYQKYLLDVDLEGKGNGVGKENNRTPVPDMN